MAPTLGATNKNPPPERVPQEKGKVPPVPPERKRKRASPKSPGSKPLPFQRTWTPDDEVRILEALAAHRQDHRKLPSTHVLLAYLDKKHFCTRELDRKVRSLKRRHDRDAKKGAPTDEHERRLYHLSKNVWDDMPNPMVAAGTRSGGGQTIEGAEVLNAVKKLDEMQESYPYLSQELMLLVNEEAQPALAATLLRTIDATKAQALDLKIKKLREELADAFMESARMRSMEMPKVWKLPFTKLQPAKTINENANIFLSEQSDKMNGQSIGVQEERLARMERQLVELKQIVISCQSLPKIENNLCRDYSPAKGMRCESAESTLRSIVAENKFTCNIMEKQIAAQTNLPHGKNEEVLLPTNKPRRKKKIDAASQVLRNVVEPRKVTAHTQQDFTHDSKAEGGKKVILLSIVREHVPVAKAILQPSSRSTMVGGMPLGSECCQVLVTEVLKKEAPLLRPFGNMKKMFDALKCSIAWPHEQIRHDTTAAMVAPDQPSHPGI